MEELKARVLKTKDCWGVSYIVLYPSDDEHSGRIDVHGDNEEIAQKIVDMLNGDCSFEPDDEEVYELDIFGVCYVVQYKSDDGGVASIMVHGDNKELSERISGIVNGELV